MFPSLSLLSSLNLFPCSFLLDHSLVSNNLHFVSYPLILLMKSSKEKGFIMDSFILCSTAIVLSLVHGTIAASTTTTQLNNGFTATPSKYDAEFEPLLADPTGVFAFGFMHVSSTKLDLAVIHLPSSRPVWRAVPFSPVNWAATTTLSFDGNLVLTDIAIQKDPIWSTKSPVGDFVVLRNTSNLEILRFGNENALPIWQSFDHPFDTLVQGQNFTALTPLFTADKRYTFRIGLGYIALYMMFGGSQEINYWKHSALEANGQLFGVVDPQGFFYLHNPDGSKAEQIPFNSFNRGFVGLHRVTLQSDGNLNAYYWDGKEWVLDYTAVLEQCGLPGACGSYGLCFPGQHTCSCLINGTDGCLQTDSGDFCAKSNSDYSFIRRAGVTVEYTDLMLSVPVVSLDNCEKMCDRNCSCWGTLYANISKNCYLIDSPIQTVEVSGNNYQGYFKVRNGKGGNGDGASGGSKKGHGMMIGLLVSFTIIFVAFATFGGYIFWDRRRNRLPQIQLGGSAQEMA
jgi:D-mannose binding lectin/S-locus glycoprotein domain/PAN domain